MTTTCNNVILAQPEADTAVSYTIPAGDSARLTFGPDKIEGLQLGENGELIVSFKDGGQLTITNFDELSDNGNLVYLADGTMVDPSILTGASQSPAAFADTTSLDNIAADSVVIAQPGENTVQEFSMEQGMKYVCDFNPANAATVEMLDGKMVLTFADGSQVIINNYQTAMTGDLPAELTTTEGVILGPAEFLTETTEVMDTLEVAELLEISEGDTIADEQMIEVSEAVDVIQPVEEVLELAQESIADKVANVEPAAGDDGLADALANIETAAGDEGGATGNSGYGFNSSATDVPLDSPDAIGALGATSLSYSAPNVTQETFIAPIDSIPTITSSIEVIDETVLTDNGIEVSGKIDATYGADLPGGITPTGMVSVVCPFGQDSLTSGGEPIVFTNTANGYVGTVNGETAVTFEIDTDGNYTFVQSLPIDHSDSTDPNDEICINFEIVATDSDGDVRTSNVQVQIIDDAPVVLSQTNAVVDETDAVGDALTTTGQFVADMGQDVGGEYCGTDEFSVNGSVDNGVLTSNGVPVTVSFDADTNTYTGSAGGEAVFTVVINPETGEYTYTQIGSLDHADGNDDNDALHLNFGIKIVDFDGDSASGTVTVTVIDDVPVTGDDANTIDETNLDQPIVINDSVSVDFGNDGQGSLTPSGTFTSTGSQANGQLTSNGVAVVVTATANGYVGVANGVTVFTLEIDPQTGDYTFTLNETLDHADGNNADDIISLNFGTIITDYDGDSDPGTITINIKDDAPVANDDCIMTDSDTGEATGNVVTGENGGNGAADVSSEAVTVTSVTIGGTTYDVTPDAVTEIQGDHGVLTISSDGSYSYQLNDGATETEINTTAFDPSSADVAGTQNSITQDGITIRSESGQDLSWFSDAVLGSGVGITGNGSDKVYGNGEELEILFDNAADSVELAIGDIGANNIGSDFTYEVHLTDGSVVTQTVTIDANSVDNGVFTFDVSGFDADITRIDLVGGPSYVLNGVTATTVDTTTVQDDFTYTITDSDGDTSTADLKIISEPSEDFNPVDVSGVGATDDTNLANGSDVENGVINVNYQGDGPGETTGNGNFGSSGNQAGNTLSSNGVPVTVSFDAATNTYTGVAGNTTVFTMVINGDASYSFTQIEPMDHSNTNADNEALFLDFGVTATDSDGDTGTGTVRITVRDDAPEATDDSAAINEDGQTATGNVLTNDSTGSDDSSVVVTTTGSFEGQYGTLVLNADGSYTYTRNGREGGMDTFQYTMRDADGDTDTAQIKVAVEGMNDEPTIITSVTGVNEVDLCDHPLVVNKTLVHDFGDDGAGAITVNGNSAVKFKVGGQDQTLTVDGAPVVITITANNGYVGTANGEVIFTLDLNSATGEYTYTQLAGVDHPGEGLAGTDDVIWLKLGVTITDSDGDSADAYVNIDIRDTAPEANDDTASVETGTGTVEMCLELDSADVQGTQSSYTNDGITISSNNGADLTWVNAHDGSSGVGIAGNGSDVVWSGGEVMEVRFAGGVNSTTISIGEVANNVGNTLTYTVYLADGTSVHETHVLTNGNVSGGVTDIDVSGYGSNIVGVDMTGGASFILADVKAERTVTTNGEVDGNVMDNDHSCGEDASVTSVNFEGQNYSVPANGEITIQGNHGTLTIAATGVYAYISSSAAEAEDVFTYTITDTDGDTDTAQLTVNIEAPEVDSALILRADVDDIANDNPDRWDFSDTYNVKYYGRGNECIDFDISAQVVDAGVGEALDHFIIKMPDVLSDFGVEFNKGTEITNGVWKIEAGDEVGLQLKLPGLEPVDGKTWKNPDYIIPQGKHDFEVSAFSTDGTGTVLASAEVNVEVVIFSSPLVLDLDGDGVELLNIEDGVTFDMDQDGQVEQTGWVGADDGLLALDKNGDGVINDRSELFGDTDGFTDGFDNLSSYDDNQDGVIDAKDAVYEDLTVWQDANSDGITDAGETLSLMDIGVVSIFLNADMPEDLFVEGNWISHTSTFATTDGETHDIVDAWFDTRELSETEVNAIEEASDTLLALNDIGDDALDISQMLEGTDDVTEAIQDFVHNNSEPGTLTEVSVCGPVEAEVSVCAPPPLEDLPQAAAGDQIII